jgi:hypothetical protein
METRDRSPRVGAPTPTAFIVSAIGCALSCCVIGAPLGLTGVILAHPDQVRGRADRFTVPAIVAGWTAVLLGVAVVVAGRWLGDTFSPFSVFAP